MTRHAISITILTVLAADITGDGIVGPTDILRILSAFGTPGNGEDVNGDGTVDGHDLLIVLSAQGLFVVRHDSGDGQLWEGNLLRTEPSPFGPNWRRIITLDNHALDTKTESVYDWAIRQPAEHPTGP